MAKKDKGGSEVEHLRGIVRNQKAIIKNLKKELARNNKRSHAYNDLEERLAEELVDEYKQEEASVFTNQCPDCKSKLEPIDLGAKKLLICQDCGYRKVK